MGRVGVVVNPIAGMGGPAGFKGTDSPEAVESARRMGIEPIAWKRAVRAMKAVGDAAEGWVVAGGEMGERAAAAAGVRVERVLPVPRRAETTAEDTVEASSLLVREGVDLILFAGGDGTAGDVSRGVGTEVPAVGVPAGVKMFSPVFGRTPEDAGLVAREFLSGRIDGVRIVDVLDAEEASYRSGKLILRIIGRMAVPEAGERIQPGKETSIGHGREVIEGIARYLREELPDDAVLILGPGSTVTAVASAMGIRGKTPLGVDVAVRGRIIARDLSAPELAEVLRSTRGPIRILVSPIGGSGFLLGRGNQQISPRILDDLNLGLENLVVVAEPEKVLSLRSLWVDLPEETRRRFMGYVRIVTGYREEVVLPVN